MMLSKADFEDLFPDLFPATDETRPHDGPSNGSATPRMTRESVLHDAGAMGTTMVKERPVASNTDRDHSRHVA